MRAVLTRPSKAKNQQQTHPTLPSVNLLSPWSFDAIATRRLRQRFVAAGCALGLVVAAGWGVQELRANQAEQVLTIEKAESARLAAQTQALTPVRIFVSSVEQQKKTVSETMSNEVQFSRVLDGLALATPADADVESIAVTLPPLPPRTVATTTDKADGTPDPTTDGAAPADGTAPANDAAPADGTPAPSAAPPVVSPCPGPDPFNTRTVIGCITLSGTAANRGSVGEFVIALGDSELFVEPFISTTTTADGEQVTFTGSVGLSEAVFSNRYADLDALLKAGSTK